MANDDRSPAGGQAPDGTVADELLAEAAAGLQSDIDADVLAEAAEILTAERVSLRMADRLSAAPGPVSMILRSGCRVEGAIESVGDLVVVLADAQGAEHCIALASIVTVAGLPAALSSGAHLPGPDSRTAGVEIDRPAGRQRALGAATWGRFLREEPMLDVRLFLFDGSSLTGLPTLVGADHVDLLMADGAMTTCALGSVSRAVRRAPMRG